MEKMIAYCGLDCAQCEAYKATQANDTQAKILIAEKWQKEFNIPHVDPESVSCDSCTDQGSRHCGYCAECKIRACGIDHKVLNCAFCADYSTCTTLNGFIANIPAAKSNLEQVRSTM
jgi:hypothetical protein